MPHSYGATLAPLGFFFGPRVADATKEPAAKSTPTTSKRKIARY
jgi:hypothetical protein